MPNDEEDESNNQLAEPQAAVEPQEQPTEQPKPVMSAIPVQYVVTVSGTIHLASGPFDGEYSAAVGLGDIPNPNSMYDVLLAWTTHAPGHPIATAIQGVSVDPRFKYTPIPPTEQPAKAE